MTIALGNKCKDLLTGFSGTCVGRSEFLYGCTRVCIDSGKLHEGVPVDSQWFDEQRVELVKATPIPLAKHAEGSTKPGGPQKDAKRHADAKR